MTLGEKKDGDLLVSHICKELERRRERNSHYSLRAYARDLETDPSYLSKIMNGRRRISRNLAAKIAKKLGVSSF